MLPGGGERLCDDDSFDAVKLKDVCPFEKRARFRPQNEGWMGHHFLLFRNRSHFGLITPIAHRARQSECQGRCCIYPLPSFQVVLASLHVVFRRLFAESCLSTRVAPEPTYSPFIDGLGCVPAGAVNAATVFLFSPDNQQSYVQQRNYLRYHTAGRRTVSGRQHELAREDGDRPSIVPGKCRCHRGGLSRDKRG